MSADEQQRRDIRNTIRQAMFDAYEHDASGADADDIISALHNAGYKIVKRRRDKHEGWGHSPRCVKGCGRAQYCRGMCRNCWLEARDAGEFVQFGTFVEEYTAATRTGLGQPAIAADMGITPRSLMRKLERYKLPVTRELRIAAKEQLARKERACA